MGIGPRPVKAPKQWRQGSHGSEMCREHFLPLDDLVDQSGAGVVRAISVDPESVDPAGDEADIRVPVGVTFTRVVALSGSRRPCPTFCPTFDPTIPSFCVASRWAASQPSSYSLPMTWENRTRCDTVGTVATFGNALFIPWPTNGMLRALGTDAASGEVPGRNVLGHGFGWRQSIGPVLHPNNHPNNLVPDCPSPSRCRQAGALGVPGYHGK